jgi:hypothetical protein
MCDMPKHQANAIECPSEATEKVVEQPDSAQQLQGPSRIVYGVIGWTGDPEVVRRIALDDEYSVYEFR